MSLLPHQERNPARGVGIVKTPDTRSALREWILARNPHMQREELADDTPILKQRIVTSLQLMELILFLEQLQKRVITPDRCRPGAFDTIDTICQTFFGGDAS